MQLAKLAVAAVAAFAAACSPPASAPATDPPPAPDAEPLPPSLPPPDEAQPRFIGRWAAAALGCDQPAWTFRADEVSTQGEVHCRFERIAITETGYDIDAACTAQAPAERHRIQLSFAESARAMLVSGGPWAAPIGLTYCGPLTPERGD